MKGFRWGLTAVVLAVGEFCIVVVGAEHIAEWLNLRWASLDFTPVVFFAMLAVWAANRAVMSRTLGARDSAPAPGQRGLTTKAAEQRS